MNVERIARYALWAGIVVTANANRRYTKLASAWVYHLVGNTFSLLLPEIYAGIRGLVPDDGDGATPAVEGVITDLVESPRYLEYVAPPAIAYILAYPTHNMYKSEWANRQLFGMGLDSIPHAATAYAITHLVYDTLASLERHAPRTAAFYSQLKWAEQHADLLSAAAVAAATLFYESGEYAIHVSELKAVRNDESRIAMEWSVADTLQDVLSNAIGTALAIWQHHN